MPDLPRAFIVLASLLLVVSAIVVGFSRPSSDSWLCLSGICRIDRVFAGIDEKGLSPESLSALLEIDPANPNVWCAYAEQLAARGDVAGADSVFERALVLGPNIPPILMRAANFDFMNGRVEHGLGLGARLLRHVDAFDEILYSYYLRSGVPVPKLLGSAVPATPRVARTWLAWVRREGSELDLRDTWSWMTQNRLADRESAAGVALTLWERQSILAAQEVWRDWVRSQGDQDYLAPERLSNRRFADKPSGSPFDWMLESIPSVDVVLGDGLELRFLGKENVGLTRVRQFATTAPGRYRFSAEVKSVGLTTDEGPYFRIFDPEDSSRVNARTSSLLGSRERSRIEVEFSVPAGTRLLAVQIERMPSKRFDNQIAGVLHVYSVSLASR